MSMCIAKASAAIVQHVPAPAVDRYLAWQHDIAAVAAQFPGYLGNVSDHLPVVLSIPEP